jgi:hypothetical protein
MWLGFGFPLAGEGEHIRDRFLVDSPSDASGPFVGVARTVFSNGLKLMSPGYFPGWDGS